MIPLRVRVGYRYPRPSRLFWRELAAALGLFWIGLALWFL